MTLANKPSEDEINNLREEYNQLSAVTESLKTELCEEKSTSGSLLNQIDVLNETMHNMVKEKEAERHLFEKIREANDMKEGEYVERLEELTNLLAQSRQAYEQMEARNNEYLQVIFIFIVSKKKEKKS